jgi:hypothetical protein
VFPLYRAVLDGRMPVGTLRAALPAAARRTAWRPAAARPDVLRPV